MKHKRRILYLASLFLLVISFVSTVVLAQTSASFNLEWNVIGSGGQESSSANYSVNGTIGQGIASQPSASSASFSVSSGFWYIDTGTTVYLPALFNN